jgi:hypothetical protein
MSDTVELASTAGLAQSQSTEHFATSEAASLNATRDYSRLTDDEKGAILQLLAEGVAQTLIAEHIGCHPSSITRVKQLFADRTDLAIQYLRGRALAHAEKLDDIATNGAHDDSIKAIRTSFAASGVIKEVSNLAVGVQVVIGQPDAPAIDPLAITLTPSASSTLSPDKINDLACGKVG